MIADHQDLNNLLRSLELTSARVLESVASASVLATSSNPEINMLFQEWLRCLQNNIIGSFADGVEYDVALESRKVGLSENAFLSLLLALQRSGQMSITHFKIDTTVGESERCRGTGE